MKAKSQQFKLGMTGTPSAGGCTTEAPPRRLHGAYAKDAPTIHDAAQLWFAFAHEPDR